MQDQEHILLFCDREALGDRLTQLLQEDGYAVDVSTPKTGFSVVDQRCDLVVIELRMPFGDSLDLLERAKVSLPAAELLVMVEQEGRPAAVEALRQGASDYCLVPFEPDELRHFIRRLLDTRRLKQETSRLRDELWMQRDESRRVLEASKQLTGLLPFLDSTLDGIVDIAQQYFDLAIAMTAFGLQGEVLKSVVSSAFHDQWGQWLAKNRSTASELQQIFSSATRRSRSYLLDHASLVPGTQPQESDLYESENQLWAIPLELPEGRLSGVIWLSGQQAMQTLRNVEMFADQLGGVLENSRLFGTHIRQLHLRTALIKTLQEISKARDWTAASRLLLEAVLKMVSNVEHTIYYCCTNPSDEKCPPDSVSVSSSAPSKQTVALDQALVNRALRTGQTVLEPEWRSHPDGASKTLVILPAAGNDRPAGALAIVSRGQDILEEDTLWMLTVLANQTAMAGSNTDMKDVE